MPIADHGGYVPPENILATEVAPKQFVDAKTKKPSNRLVIWVAVAVPLAWIGYNVSEGQGYRAAVKEQLRSELVASCDATCQNNNRICRDLFGIDYGPDCMNKNRELNGLIFEAKKRQLDEGFARNTALNADVIRHGGVWTDADKRAKQANEDLMDAPVVVTYLGRRYQSAK